MPEDKKCCFDCCYSLSCSTTCKSYKERSLYGKSINRCAKEFMCNNLCHLYKYESGGLEKPIKTRSEG